MNAKSLDDVVRIAAELDRELARRAPDAEVVRRCWETLRCVVQLSVCAAKTAERLDVERYMPSSVLEELAEDLTFARALDAATPRTSRGEWD